MWTEPPTQGRAQRTKSAKGMGPQIWYLRSRSPCLVLGALLADQCPPPVQASALWGRERVPRSLPGPQPTYSGINSPPPAEPPNFAARRAPPGPRPTSLGLSCGGGGGAAAGPLSPTLSPGEAAAHNCE